MTFYKVGGGFGYELVTGLNLWEPWESERPLIIVAEFPTAGTLAAGTGMLGHSFAAAGIAAVAEDHALMGNTRPNASNTLGI